MKTLPCIALCALLADTAAAQLHFLTALDNSPTTSFDRPAIAPDGSRVLCRQASVWGTLAFAPGSAFTTIAGPTIATLDMLWRPDSLGWFFSEPETAATRRVRTIVNGALSTVVGAQPLTLAVVAVDPGNTTLLCVHRPTATTSVLRAITLATGAFTDILTTIGTIDNVSVSPNGQTVLFRIPNGTPFTPNNFFTVPIAGGVMTLITPAGVLNGDNAVWTSSTTMAVEELVSPFIQISQFTTAGVRSQLTAGRRNHTHLSVANNNLALAFLVSEVLTIPPNPTTVEAVPAAMMATGGGIVMFDNFFNWQMFDRPSLWFDPTGLSAPRLCASMRNAAVGGSSQILGANVENEVLASPAVINTPQTIIMGNPAVVISAIIGLGRLGPGVPVPPFVNLLFLDLAQPNVTLFTTTANPGVFTWTPSSSFLGANLFFQGATIDAAGTVTLGRMAECTVQ